MAGKIWRVALVAAALIMVLAASSRVKPTITFDYTFAPKTEPDGFRGIKWQTDIASLDPFNTMEVVGIQGGSAYYQKKQDNLRLGVAPVQSIVYEFWGGKFASVFITIRGEENYLLAREYLFDMYGRPPQPPAYARMDVQDFQWIGYRTRMFLRYSDYDRTGRLSMYSVGMLNRQNLFDTRLMQKIEQDLLKEWEKPAKPGAGKSWP
jgi:hypothetical protein